MATFLSLPKEILLHIISFLGKRDVLNLTEICKSLKDFISQSSAALEKVCIHVNANKSTSENIFLRKYSKLYLKTRSINESILNHVLMVCHLRPQLRILIIDCGMFFKLSYIQRILIGCERLKVLDIRDNGMKIDEITGELPTTRINKLTVISRLKVLDILQACRVSRLFVDFEGIRNFGEEKETLKNFCDSQVNLKVLHIYQLNQKLYVDTLPGSLKELRTFTSDPLQNYDFSMLIKSQKLERLSTRFSYDPGYFNQLSLIKSLTHLDLTLENGHVRIFTNLNVMENVKSLKVENYFERQDFLIGKFPNLRHLKLENLSENYQFLYFFRDALQMIFGALEVEITKIPFGLFDINFQSFELFIKDPKIIFNSESKITTSITKFRYWEKEIELIAIAEINEQIIDMKMILKKFRIFSFKPFLHNLNLMIFDKEILCKIASFLDHQDVLRLRLVNKKLNEVLTNSEEFQSRRYFEVNKNNLDTFLKRKFTSIAIKDFAYFPKFNWCAYFLKNQSENLKKIILHFGDEVHLMMLRNLMNLCQNIKEVEIYENPDQNPIKEGFISVSEQLTLNLDSLKVQGNLRVLHVFIKSKIKSLTIIKPKNSIELGDFLKHSENVERFELSNQDEVENVAIKKVLNEHFDFNFTPQETSLVVFVAVDFAKKRRSLRKLKLEQLKVWSVFEKITPIEKLYLIDSEVNMNVKIHSVKELFLLSCKFVDNGEHHVELTKAKLTKLVKKLMDKNLSLAKIETRNEISGKDCVIGLNRIK